MLAPSVHGKDMHTSEESAILGSGSILDPLRAARRSPCDLLNSVFPVWSVTSGEMCNDVRDCPRTTSQ